MILKQVWSITMSNFQCSLSNGEGCIVTDRDSTMLAEVIIADHIGRSRYHDRTRDEYRVEDFSDEMAIYLKSRTEDPHWIKLINLQYEGPAST